MRRLLLFDVDGTLLVTGGAGMRAMRRAGERIFGAAFRWDGIVVSGGLDPMLYDEATRQNGVSEAEAKRDVFRDTYLEELERELREHADDVRLLPGLAELLADCRERESVDVGLLTGNFSAAVPIKLQAVGLDPEAFDVCVFGDHAPTRPAMASLALERWAEFCAAPVDPARALVIGDTPRDVHCAHENGCPALAVATGRYDLAELREAGADIVAADLRDPTPIHDWLDAAAEARCA